MNEDASQYVVKRARDLRIGDEITHVARSEYHDWRPYAHVVTARTSMVTVGAAASYVYRVRVPRQQPAQLQPYAMRGDSWATPAAVAKEARIATVNDAMAKRAKRGYSLKSLAEEVRARAVGAEGNHDEWPREYLGQWTEPLTSDDLLPDDVKVTVKPYSDSFAARTCFDKPAALPYGGARPTKIDGVDVTLLQEMYTDRQHDRPLKGLWRDWRPTPAQREYLHNWWSCRVTASTAKPEPIRASDVKQRAPRVAVVVDRQDEP